MIKSIQTFVYDLAKKKKKAEQKLQTFGYDLMNPKKPTQAQIDEYGREWRDRRSGKQI